MYPFLRMVRAVWTGRRAPPLGVFDAHVSRHICWPWDLDPWVELNNGRTLTLYDLGRIPLGLRTGLAGVLRARGWGLTVAGSSVRYRRRVRGLDRFTMVTRCLGWDARFFYMEQSMWVRGECTSHMILRAAMVGKGGIVAPSQAAAALGVAPDSPALPPHVLAWIAAEAERPWPPHPAPDAVG
jgi:acyl-CoA thioesterase FadM